MNVYYLQALSSYIVDIPIVPVELYTDLDGDPHFDIT